MRRDMRLGHSDRIGIVGGDHGTDNKATTKAPGSVKPSIHSEAQASVKCDCRQNKTLADRRTGKA